MREILNQYTLILLCVITVATSACSNRWAAPVEERSVGDHSGNRINSKAQPNIYSVKSGDSLYTIGFRYGLDYHNIAQWNQINKPYTIYPGQKLHLQPGQKPFSKPAIVKTQPLSRKPASKPVKSSSKPVAVSKPATQSVKNSSTRTSTISNAKKTTVRSDVRWQWPTNGTVIETYLAADPTRSGLDIAGSEGQSIRAAASGSVVYSGNGLLGYGELIIIKHNDRFLSAYAHNRTRLVAEGESIRAGQKIAEMGRGENGRIKLHFEIRVNGKPVNPRQYLPSR